ncbi:hypothetical protein ISCGN_029433 [Ixodes scapularis]
MKNCSFGWTKSQKKSTLTSISLRLAPRSLVGVTGPIGTGKSALLAAILGDMHCMKGDVKITGRIAYTPQVADIFNMTIRDNIVFGSKFDDIRYARVLNALLFRSMGGLLLAFGSRKFSVHLHNEMLSHVLFSPVSFFDTNPRGRILNRFAVDVEAVDARLYLFGKQFIQAMLLTVAKLIAAGSQAPGIMIVGSGATVTFGIGMMLILRAANMARFLETTRFSRTLQHVTESMKSLSSLRSYGVVERFCNHFCHLTDYHLKPYATFCAYYRFSRTLGNLCGFAVVLASILFMLWNPFGGDSASSSGLGLALSASLSDPNLVRGTLRSNLDPTGIHNDEDLWKALEQAHLAEFVLAHPDKLLLETGDGGASLRRVTAFLPLSETYLAITMKWVHNSCEE